MAKKVTTTAALPAATLKSAEQLFQDSLWLRAPGDSRAQREEFLEEPTVMAVRGAAPEVQIEFFRRTLERIGALPERLGYAPNFLSTHEDYPEGAAAILKLIIPTLPLSGGDLAFGLAQLSNLQRIVDWHHAYLRPLLDQLEAHVKAEGATPELKAAMERFLVSLSAKDEDDEDDEPDARQMAAVAKFKALIKSAKPSKASAQRPNGSRAAFSGLWRPSLFKQPSQVCKPSAVHKSWSLKSTPGAVAQAKKIFASLNQLRRTDPGLVVQSWAEKKKAIQELARSEPAVRVVFLYMTFDAIAEMRERLGPTVRSLEDVAQSDKRTRNAYEKYVRIDDQPGYPTAPAIAAKVLLRDWLPPLVEGDYAYFVDRVADVDFVVERSHVYLLDLVYRLQQHVQANGLTPDLNEATGRLLSVMQQPLDEEDDHHGLDQLAQVHVGPVPAAPEMKLTWEMKGHDANPADAAEVYRRKFAYVDKKSCLPIEQFEKHELVKKLLADKPAVQIAFARLLVGSELKRQLVGATAAKPIRALKESDRSSERKMEVYRHFRNLWDNRFYNLGAAIALDHVFRRDLPLTHDDLVYLTNQLADMRMVVLACNTYVPGLVRHLKARIEKNGTTLELSTAVKRLASAMDVPDQPEDHQKVYHEVKALAAAKPAQSKKVPAAKSAAKGKSAAGPAPGGDVQAQAAACFDKLLKLKADYDELMQHKDVLEILQADPAVHVAIIRILAERIGAYRKTLKFPKKGGDPWADGMWAYACLEGAKDYPYRAAAIVRKLLSRKLPFTANDLTRIIGGLADLEIVRAERHDFLPGLLKQVQKHIDEHGVAPELAKAMRRLADAIDMPPFTVQGNTGAALQRRTAATLREMAALVTNAKAAKSAKIAKDETAD